jgi:NAD(P)-dependent dehydrogenase (short-subunit alcohol dehydrogenase family)
MDTNMQSLVGKNVIVLGASRGLGAMIAQRAATEGARTLVVARRRLWLDELARSTGCFGGGRPGEGVQRPRSFPARGLRRGPASRSPYP